MPHGTRLGARPVATCSRTSRRPTPAGTPADQVEARERRRRLDIKVKALSPHHRAVLVLRDIEGFTYDEIAQVTDTPIGSVKARCTGRAAS